MNPVRQFLDKGDYTFEEGVAVLLLYSANRGVNDFIVNSHDKRHLGYELNRLARHPRLEPIPGRKPAEPRQPAEKQEAPADDTPQEQPKDEAPADDSDKDTTTFLDLQHHKYTRLEDMPTQLTRELWLKNSDEYKELQHCHQQMKQANSDAGRADWRKKVHQLSQSLKDRWKLIDGEIERHLAEAEAKAEQSEKPAFNPLNCRAYISKALKKDQWDDKTKAEVQHRVDMLVANNQAIGDDTRKRLVERGITL